MAGHHPNSGSDGSLDDLVVVSNRGPLSFRLDEDGRLVRGQSAGGLAGSLYPMVAGTGATWVACALSDADRLALAQGLMGEDGLRIELLDPDPGVYRMAYDVVSNATLWFCHHHLFDAARRPRSDRRWSEAWDAYRQYNALFAERVAAVAPEGGRVLVQDYHLTLVGSELARTGRICGPCTSPTPRSQIRRSCACCPPPWSTSCWPAWPVSAPAGSTPSDGPPATGPATTSSAPTGPGLRHSSRAWPRTPIA